MADATVAASGPPPASGPMSISGTATMRGQRRSRWRGRVCADEVEHRPPTAPGGQGRREAAARPGAGRRQGAPASAPSHLGATSGRSAGCELAPGGPMGGSELTNTARERYHLLLSEL